MNISIITGLYPSKLTHVKVIPILKGGVETEPSNYRPISVLSLFNRLQEPMSRSMQLPYSAYVTAFLQTDLRLVYLFSCEKKAVPVQ